jgi:peptide/nickel transport system substrate-binding protein
MSWKNKAKAIKIALVCLCAGFLSMAALAAEPVRGGTLRLALRIPTASLDPLFGNAPGTDRKIYNLFAENLLYQDEDGKFNPGLAKNWTISADGLSIMFDLRAGVKFQDGTSMDAAAVKFNFDRFLDPKITAASKQYMTDIDSVEVVSDLSVRVNLKRKSVVMLSMLAVEPGSIMSPTALKEKGADFTRSPVGTGPFQIISWSGNEIIAKRNPHYWKKAADGQPLPFLDRVEIKIIPNSAIRMVEIQSGNVQFIDGLEPKDFEKITKNAALDLLPGGVSITQLLSYNLTRAPFNNIELRKAVSFAINRAAIQKVISQGKDGGGVLKGFEPQTTWVFDESVRGHQFDLAKAREHYAKSGHKGPIVLSSIQRDPDIQVAQLLQSMLKAAGMDLKIEMSDRLSWVSKASSNSLDMGLSTASIARPDPDVSYSTYFSAKASKNYSGFDTKTLTDPLVVRARGEFDLVERRKIYSELQQFVLDQYLYSPLFWYPIRDAATKRLKGFKREVSLSWFYDELWLAP